jgi:hypothetical protein
MSNRYGGPRGGWTSIVQSPFGAYATLGVREVGRDLLLVHDHHRGGMERAWLSVVGWRAIFFSSPKLAIENFPKRSNYVDKSISYRQ